jgi:hypothetical protein
VDICAYAVERAVGYGKVTGQIYEEFTDIAPPEDGVQGRRRPWTSRRLVDAISDSAQMMTVEGLIVPETGNGEIAYRSTSRYRASVGS